MRTITHRRCAAWRDCGNLAVPTADLSFRGFCPACEAVANSQTCCFEGCHALATERLGREVIFPMCAEHARLVQA